MNINIIALQLMLILEYSSLLSIGKDIDLNQLPYKYFSSFILLFSLINKKKSLLWIIESQWRKIFEEKYQCIGERYVTILKVIVIKSY